MRAQEYCVPAANPVECPRRGKVPASPSFHAVSQTRLLRTFYIAMQLRRLLHNFLKVLAVTVLSILHTTSAQAAGPAKPNILFLFTDDMRADCIGALGHPVVKTPNIDTLVKRGMTFDNAFCLGANIGAVCTPSRNMLLSGRTYFRWKGQNLAPADGPNLPVALKGAGYETWHLGKKGNTATNIQATFEHNNYIHDDQGERLNGEPGRDYVDGAIKFLTQERDKKRPFFMYLAFGNPHDPRVAAEPYLKLYDRDAIPLPENYAPQHPWNIGSNTVRDELLAPFPRTPDVVRQHLHEYYAVISCMDGHIGRLLATMKSLELEENTIIIFSSDHGLGMGSHGLLGKQNVYDDGFRAPLVFAGPGIPQGRTKALCYLMDIMPTICDLAGATKPQGMDALSLTPVIDGKEDSVRDALFLSYTNTQRAIREDRWKLIRFPQVDKTQLFDLSDDPGEVNDLATQPEQAERVEALMKKLASLQKEVGDDAPLKVDSPSVAEFTPPTEEERAKLNATGKARKNANKAKSAAR
ncbi:arylsulfatase A-like enzyme [Roseimicrobium gellanilyticum]|uniref:Arylsulfatase A-like enzyme n=2 Tax=Roseimicrobium gellanilyticum TaxID=748857 RepID=A0A366HSL8_9BACT|nr:arylsulfatase A-like enzyme [Roseimicrobium gellanilyticum]